MALAREFNYSLHIVTLEGEHLSPGGSISGGAFRNSSNLLGRKREIDELKSQLEDLTGRRESLQHQIQTIQADQELLRKEEESSTTKIQEAYLEQNAAKMNLDRVLEQKYEGEKAAAALAAETAELNQQKAKASEDKNQAEQKLEALAQKEAAIQKAAADAQESLEQLTQEGKQAVQGEQAAQGNQAVLQGVKPGVESEQAVAGWKGNESGIEGVMKAAKEGECQTCEQRKYQDGSDDPGVSFKTAAHIAPEQAASAVKGHEMEHVVREQAKAEREDRKVVSQNVTIHTDICPECGKVYVSGGTTRTVTAADTQQKQMEQTGNEQYKPFFAVA